MKTLIKLPLYIAVLWIIFLCMVSGAHAWEPEYIGVSGKVQDIQRMQWVREHSHQREPQYIYNDPQSIADREFQVAVNKLNERKQYVGR